MLKKLLLILCLFVISFLIGAIFWQQEIKYQMPTPVPPDYSPIVIGEKINLSNEFLLSDSKPILIHFFNPDCPCSKFNLGEFNNILLKYKDRVDFYIIAKSDEFTEAAELKNKFAADVKILTDSDDVIANKCGVYATPQAVLIDTDNKLYYRGNYNISRYCTSPESNFVVMAIDSVLANKKSPVFNELAYIPYGCEIPKKQ